MCAASVQNVHEPAFITSASADGRERLGSVAPQVLDPPAVHAGSQAPFSDMIASTVMTSTATIHTTDLYPDSVHTAFRALVAALGPSERNLLDSQDEAQYEMHPVFGLLQHGRGEDDGRAWRATNKLPTRGDVLTVPYFTEAAEIGLMEISFHKGETNTWVVTFPEAPEPIVEAMLELLQGCETR